MSYLYLNFSEGKYTNINSNICKINAYILNIFNICPNIKITIPYIKQGIAGTKAKLYICTLNYKKSRRLKRHYPYEEYLFLLTVHF